MNRWLDGDSDKASCAIGKVKDETNIETALTPAPNVA
jgi:hypothetical protein